MGLVEGALEIARLARARRRVTALAGTARALGLLVDVTGADRVLLADERVRRDRTEVLDDWCLIQQLATTFPAPVSK
jgi:hypothetical protein